MPVEKDLLGKTATPDIMTMATAVKSLTFDDTPEEARQLELAAEQALGDMKVFVKYAIITMNQHRSRISQLASILKAHGLLYVEEKDDDTPRA